MTASECAADEVCINNTCSAVSPSTPEDAADAVPDADGDAGPDAPVEPPDSGTEDASPPDTSSGDTNPDVTVPSCGDGSCNGSESCSSCASDCGACPASCGDGSCNGGESCSSCASDCGGCPASCGDGSCNGGESCSSCASDCGACPPPPALPGTPTNIHLDNPTGDYTGQVDYDFREAASGGPVTRYRVYKRTGTMTTCSTSDLYEYVTSAGPTVLRTGSIEDLPGGSLLCVSVVAEGPGGLSLCGASSASTCIVVEPGAAPSAPTNLSLHNPSDGYTGEMDYEFREPTAGVDVRRYRVYKKIGLFPVCSDAELVHYVTPTSDGATHHGTIGGLTAGALLCVAIQSEGFGGARSDCRAAAVCTGVESVVPPAPPTNIILDNPTGDYTGQVRYSFREPTSGGPVTRYRVYKRIGDMPTCTDAQHVHSVTATSEGATHAGTIGGLAASQLLCVAIQSEGPSGARSSCTADSARTCIVVQP